MSTELAEKQAEGTAERIREDVENGHPFGLSEDTGEELSAYDWLEGVLDIEYRVDMAGEYRSGKVLVGFGGPNVWIDTATREVVVAWWSEPVSRSLPAEFIDGLDEALSELWGMR